MISSNVTTRAMLVHSNERTGQIQITSHNVLEIDKGMGFTLGAGRVFSTYDKEALLGLLNNEDTAVEFLPSNLLVSSRSMLVWYLEPQVTELAFPKETVSAPLPGLIFVASASKPLRCFAYCGRKRPTPTTELFYVPLGNVYADASFCSGNVKVPTQVLVENIPAWENFALKSINTHEGSVSPIRGCDSFDGMIEFYRDLATKQAKSFPRNKLRKCETHNGFKTLEAVIQGSK